MEHHGHPITDGLNRPDFVKIVNDMPRSIGWVVKKVGGIDQVMRRCDSNGDGTVYLKEARGSKHCLADCWKQSAIMAFLN